MRPTISQADLLVQAAPHWNARGNYFDLMFPPAGSFHGFAWARYAYTSACIYPDFAREDEMMCRSFQTFKKRDLAKIVGADQLCVYMATIENVLTNELDRELADRDLWAIPREWARPGGRYPICEHGGLI